MEYVLSLMPDVQFVLNEIDVYNSDYKNEFEIFGCVCEMRQSHEHGRRRIASFHIQKFAVALGLNVCGVCSQ